MSTFLRALTFAFAVLSLTFALGLLSSTTPVADAQHGVPPNEPKRGLVYDGLEKDADGPCEAGFRVKSTGKPGEKPHCTPGPDAAPSPKFDVALSVDPVPFTTTLSNSGIVCDGDGISGRRVQILYAHAADVPSRHAQYLVTFQQWVAGMDAIVQNSASKTGGNRHIRFVHDANCNPIIPDVILSAAGDDNFYSTSLELANLGYSRPDRKYVVFVDARIYCGIGDMSADEQPGPGNSNNNGPSYSRIDAGCWSDLIATHELMHNIGAVQLSAPHSAHDWHSYDGYDIMSRPTNGMPVQVLCSDLSSVQLLDCSTDDYFSTRPSASSYLATHWNAANSLYLIGAPTPSLVRVDSVTSGEYQGKAYRAVDSFKQNGSVVIRIHVVGDNQSNLTGAYVSFDVRGPDGSIACALWAASDTSGIAEGSCDIPKRPLSGIWHAHVNNVITADRLFDASQSKIDKSFMVR